MQQEKGNKRMTCSRKAKERGNWEKKGFTWTETEMDAKMQARMRTQAVQTVNPTLWMQILWHTEFWLPWNIQVLIPETCEYLTTCGERDFTDADEDSGRNCPGLSRRAQFSHRSPYKQRTFCGWSQRDVRGWLIEGAMECGSSRSGESQGHRFSPRVPGRSTAPLTIQF